MSVRMALLAALLGAAGIAQAQERRASGAIDGVVTDTSLAPLADATAWILGSNIQVSTGENGRFRILALPAGPYILMVRKVGYAPLSTVVHVAERDTLRASFALQRAVVALDSVVVNAISLSPRMMEFEARRKNGGGQYMTQAQIEKLNFVGPSDLLRTFMSVYLSSDGKTISARRMQPIKTCPFQFFVDGIAVPTPRDIDSELPSPKELAGIEVYANSAMIPLQYKTISGGAFCGVILMWTR